MNRDTARRLNQEFKELRQQPGTPHMAVVSSTSPLQVRVGGQPTGLSAVRLESYTPALNDTVLVIVGMGPRLIVGKIVP